MFNITGSIFLNNFHRGVLSNILSGAAATQVTGDNCLHVTLSSGSFSKTISGSQHKIGNTGQLGIYSATFAISEYDTSEMYEEAIKAGSASFTEIWSSIDGTVGYHTGSLIIKSPFRSSFDGSEKRLILSLKNLRSTYFKNSKTWLGA